MYTTIPALYKMITKVNFIKLPQKEHLAPLGQEISIMTSYVLNDIPLDYSP